MKQNHIAHWLIIGALFLSSVFFVKINGQNFRASVIHFDEEPSIYDGLEFPIKKVPNWVNVTDAERKMTYKNFPESKLVSIPPYDVESLKIPVSRLQYGLNSHDLIRNMQITYPVVYSGTYLFDGIEGSGSHPAVDIKALPGTPVHVIGNGRVIKVSYQNDGFGHHVVVKHTAFPSFSDASKMVTLYSSYSHLEAIKVKEGDILTRGQIIGEVGRTGTATTDHLHFQIDTNEAPWHPYWPFSYKEAQAAGLNFWDGVNSALGKENLLKYTIHPVQYVRKYKTDDNTFIATAPDQLKTAPDELKSAPDEMSDQIPNNNESLNSNVIPIDSANDIVKDTINTAVSPETVQIFSSSAEIFSNDVVISTLVPSDTVVSEPIVSAPIETRTVFTAQPVVTNFSDLSFYHDFFMLSGKTLVVNIEAKDREGRTVENPSFHSLTVSETGGIGTLDHTSFTMDDFYQGKTAFGFTPSKIGTAQFIVELDEKTKFFSSPVTVQDVFLDIKSFDISHDGNFEPEVAEEITIIALDENGTRTPKYNLSGPVNIILKSGQGILSPSEIGVSQFYEGKAVVRFTPGSLDDVIFEVNYLGIRGMSKPLRYLIFSDVVPKHKNFEAIQYLKKENVIAGYSDGTFRPQNKVTRAEALKMIFSSTNQQVDDGVSLKFSDVTQDQWFHRYVATAYNLKIVNGYGDGTFRPNDQVTRAEFLKMLFSAFAIDVPIKVDSKPFKDVDVKSWFAPYVQYAKEKGVLAITGAEFKANEKISRSEVAEMVYRLLKS
ncbi:S-layer homology domain-containing protein [Candidatus Peregrinibacteria bacterium]|nr:S-layer homology domain-containing protein [Candidatus Peregrinibacteria bacterium]